MPGDEHDREVGFHVKAVLGGSTTIPQKRVQHTMLDAVDVPVSPQLSRSRSRNGKVTPCSHHGTLEKSVSFFIPEVVGDLVELHQITSQEHVAVGEHGGSRLRDLAGFVNVCSPCAYVRVVCTSMEARAPLLFNAGPEDLQVVPNLEAARRVSVIETM